MIRSKLSKYRSGIALAVAAVTATLLTFGGAQSAHAQIQDDVQTYAITDFVVGVPSGDVDLGAAARDAVRLEMSKKGLEMLPQESVSRQLSELGFVPPLTRPADLIRLGQALGARFLVTGEVNNFQFSDVSGGRQAAVILRVIIKDAATGISVNGSAKSGLSGVRTGDVSNATLLNEAINDAAFHTVMEITTAQIPTATVLNTLPDRALINRGARSGFKVEDMVLIQRGSETIGTGRVLTVDPDSAFIKFVDIQRGVATGDKIVRIVEPPVIRGFGPNGEMRINERKSSNGNQGLIAILILVVILGFLLGSGRGSNSDLVQDVQAEAITQANDIPGVRVSWTRDPFLRGNPNLGGPVQWQVFRDGVGAGPVAIAPASASSIIDDTAQTNFQTTYLNPSDTANSVIDPAACSQDDTEDSTATALVAGVPSRYSVRVVYRVSALDLPGLGSSGSGGGGGTTGGGGGLTTGGTGGGTTGGGGLTTGGGTTGGTTTGGTTTGGTTTGGGGGGGEYCYYVSLPVQAQGVATALPRPSLLTPQNNALVQAPLNFQVTSVRGPVASLTIEYVIQLSTQPTFPAGETVTLDPFLDFNTPNGQTLSSPTTDTSVYFPNANTLYWRAGARNVEDSPGPVADASGKRYIFSGARAIRRN